MLGSGQLRGSVSVPANSSVLANLEQYERFGPFGGQIQVAATVPLAGSGGIILTIMTGSDSSTPTFQLPVEKNPGVGPDSDTPAATATGTGLDVIQSKFTNTTGGAIVVTWQANILNVAGAA